jgi:hypothetical protein
MCLYEVKSYICVSIFGMGAANVSAKPDKNSDFYAATSYRSNSEL